MKLSKSKVSFSIKLAALLRVRTAPRPFPSHPLAHNCCATFYWIPPNTPAAIRFSPSIGLSYVNGFPQRKQIVKLITQTLDKLFLNTPWRFGSNWWYITVITINYDSIIKPTDFVWFLHMIFFYSWSVRFQPVGGAIFKMVCLKGAAFKLSKPRGSKFGGSRTARSWFFPSRIEKHRQRIVSSSGLFLVYFLD